MASRRSHRRSRVVRTQRRWRYPAPSVGLVGPDEVDALRTRVHDYRVSLQASIDRAAESGHPISIQPGDPFSIQRWSDLAGRCMHFEDETHHPWSPFPYIYAGAAYDRGRQLIIELDAWRDELARQSAPGVPPPIPVPNSDIGIAGGLGFALAGLVAILALRELR